MELHAVTVQRLGIHSLSSQWRSSDVRLGHSGPGIVVFKNGPGEIGIVEHRVQLTLAYRGFPPEMRGQLLWHFARKTSVAQTA
eukprot:12173773-Alexandrium_andersonii.AAC.1